MRENLSNLLKELKTDPRSEERMGRMKREGKKSSITNHNNIDLVLLQERRSESFGVYQELFCHNGKLMSSPRLKLKLI